MIICNPIHNNISSVRFGLLRLRSTRQNKTGASGSVASTIRAWPIKLHDLRPGGSHWARQLRLTTDLSQCSSNTSVFAEGSNTYIVHRTILFEQHAYSVFVKVLSRHVVTSTSSAHDPVRSNVRNDAVNRTEPFRSVTETETVGSVENPGLRPRITAFNKECI